MNKHVVGYAFSVLSVAIAGRALASLPSKPLRYGTSTALVVVAVGSFAVTWITLLDRRDATRPEQAEDA